VINDRSRHARTRPLLPRAFAVVGTAEGSSGPAHTPGYGVDTFKSERAWLYIAIVASAYMVSRGLAKSGSHDIHSDNDDNR
jgi:hypothetical protein